MNLQNKTNQKGFTIVELLIVIVVIGILAAISIVAYNGIQNRAKASQRQADANGIVKVAEAVNARADSTGYPTSAADFALGDAKLPANVAVNVVTGASTATTLSSTTGPTESGGTKTYIVRSCGANVGLIVYYWDPSVSSGNQKTVAAGSAVLNGSNQC